MTHPAPGAPAGPGTEEVAAVIRAYYRALEDGTALAPFYATDEEAGPLGPVVKIGSGEGEMFSGYDDVAREVDRVSAALVHNRLQSRSLVVRRRGDLAWFADQVWWSGEEGGRPFASLTRWTGVCLRCPGGWRFLQVHVSEGV
jgi:hypothetical protein